MELSFGANGFESLFPVKIGSICFGRTSGEIVWIYVSPLGHNDNIIQIKLSLRVVKGVYSRSYLKKWKLIKNSYLLRKIVLF